MAQLFKNNAFSTLGATLSNVATSMTVASGHGDRFPIVTAPDFCMLTLQDASNNIEIIKVTARTSGADSMTIQRAQEGTTARSWAIGDVVELRVTSSALNPLGLFEGGATAAALRETLVVPTRTGGDASGTWGINISGNAATATTAADCSGNAATVTNGVYTTGDQTIGGVKTFSSRAVFGAAAQEKQVAIGASNIDLALGNYFTRTISGATTLTVSNIPASGVAASFILDLTNGGSGAITWWANVKWAGGTAPTLTASGRDVLGFFTHNGGATWTGLVLGKDVK